MKAILSLLVFRGRVIQGCFDQAICRQLRARNCHFRVPKNLFLRAANWYDREEMFEGTRRSRIDFDAWSVCIRSD